MSALFKGQQKKNLQAPSSTNSLASSSTQNVSGTSSRTVIASSSSSAKRGDVNESSDSSRTKVASSSNSARGGDNNSDHGNHHSHHGSKEPLSQTSRRDGKRPERPEAKRSSTSGFLSNLTLSRSDDDLIKDYKHLEQKHRELQRERPGVMTWVRASQPLELWENTYKKQLDELDRLREEIQRIADAIDEKKRVIPRSKVKLDAAWDSYNKVYDGDTQLVQQQQSILDKMPDNHPYKIRVLKEEEKERALDDKYHKKAEKARKAKEEERKRDEQERNKREKEIRDKDAANRYQKEKRQRLDEKAEREKYTGRVGKFKSTQATGSQS
ncbi:hypothetical protein OCU04_012420 [Sclerotinia nivalis]|uniref:Uncharacterized protein n=1 Tax=Sclerotinia nivalis TaxID=352851 RepID=A0A9X0A9A9_9HELO|nr:hypothetical protein OCU04_012420 [Sclerotinia nivalis]